MVDPSKSENDKYFGTEEVMQEFRNTPNLFFQSLKESVRSTNPHWSIHARVLLPFGPRKDQVPYTSCFFTVSAWSTDHNCAQVSSRLNDNLSR